MSEPAPPSPIRVRVGGLTRFELHDQLRRAGVLLNGSAMTLLDDAAFDRTEVDDVQVIERAVGDLGLPDGGSLSVVLAAAEACGLGLCPPTTGPYLRLSVTDQRTAPDSIMSNGRAPSGAITIASAALRDDDEYPKGFYLRVVDGVAWLRGYRCTDQHTWSAEDLFAFRVP